MSLLTVAADMDGTLPKLSARMRRLGLFGMHKLGRLLEKPNRYLPLMGQTGLRERAVVHVYMMRPDGPDVSVSIPTAMNAKYRVRRALDSRLMAARAFIRIERI